MKVLKWIIIVLLIITSIVVIIGLVLPKEFMASSSIHIKLSPEQVFHSVATFSDRQEWDPWIESDPEASSTIKAEPGYIGSTYEWEGEKLGQGKMLVDTVVYGKLIRSSIWFKPDGKPADVAWTFNEEDGETHVTWSMTSKSGNPFLKVMNVLMKDAFEKSFDKGLSNLKKFLETKGVIMSRLENMGVKSYPSVIAIVAEGESTMDGIETTIGMLFDMVMVQVTTLGLQPSGAPFAKYYDYNEELGTTKIIAGIPVAGAGNINGVSSFEGFNAIKGTHIGPYTEFTYSYQKLDEFMQTNKIENTGVVWEFYFTDPQTEPDQSKWVAEIAFVIN